MIKRDFKQMSPHNENNLFFKEYYKVGGLTYLQDYGKSSSQNIQSWL